MSFSSTVKNQSVIFLYNAHLLICFGNHANLALIGLQTDLVTLMESIVSHHSAKKRKFCAVLALQGPILVVLAWRESASLQRQGYGFQIFFLYPLLPSDGAKFHRTLIASFTSLTALFSPFEMFLVIPTAHCSFVTSFNQWNEYFSVSLQKNTYIYVWCARVCIYITLESRDVSFKTTVKERALLKSR